MSGDTPTPKGSPRARTEGAISQLLDPHTLAQLKSLSLRVERVVDGLLQGVHRSPHRGRSVEFAEHKEYTPGDETRHIDWRAFARLDKVYVKRFEQETNLSAWFAIDASESMSYGAKGGLTKYDYAATVLSSLAFLLLRQQDAVGLVSFSDTVRQVVPPRSQLSHLKRLTDALESDTPHGLTQLGAGLQRVAETASKRGMVFVFSDFFGDTEEALVLLRRLVSKGHVVIAFHVLDGDELSFPFEGVVHFEGLERRERLLAEPRLVRDRYLAAMEAHQAVVRKGCLEAQVRHILVDTREPIDRLILGVLGALGRGGSRGGSRGAEGA
ncbi:MAG: DUF58 domain-containing protein [Myxococcota bacterium]